MLTNTLEQPEAERQPLLFVLDFGMLSTSKEVQDSSDGKDTRDMTRAQVVKAIFRVLTLKLGKANIPMIVTNHTYDVVGAYVPTKEMGGGSGLKYAASTIIYLAKSKEKDGKEVIGNIIRCETKKSRFTKENAKITTVFSMTNVDSTGIMDYWSWVKSMESSQNGVIGLLLVNLPFILLLSLPILTSTSPKE